MTSVVACIASTRGSLGQRRLSRSDRLAIELAIRHSPVATVCVPLGDHFAAAAAHASGCQHLHAMTSDLTTLPAGIGANFDVALFGTGLVEWMGDLAVAKIAESRSASLLFDVLAGDWSTSRESANGAHRDNVSGTITRDRGRGAREILRFHGPAILVLSNDGPRPKYISRFRMGHALAEVSRTYADWKAEPTPDAGVVPIRPRTRRDIRQTSVGTSEQRFDRAFGIGAETSDRVTNAPIVADPQTSAQYLLRYLAHQGLVPGTRATETRANVGESGNWQELAASRGPSTATARSPAPASRTGPLDGDLAPSIARRPRRIDDSQTRALRHPRRVRPEA